MWGEVIRYAEVTSTNDLARDYARRGHAEGTAIVAEHQVAGRGRRGRSWTSPAGASLLVSYVLRPPAFAARSAWITLAGGIAAARAMAELADVTTALKWPNDVLHDGRKLGGVLAETFRADDSVCVLGLGLNLNQTAADFGPELAATATSLRLATGREFDARALLGPLSGHLQELYGYVLRGDTEAVRDAWRGLDVTAGQLVSVEEGDEVWEGRAVDIDEHGALCVEAGDDLRRVSVGDVSLRLAQ